MTLGANPTAATIVSILIAIAGVYLVQQPETMVQVFGWTFILIGVVGTVVNIIMWRERRQRRTRARAHSR
jgi:membrane protein DedA with SNARE-associated domain